MRKQPRAICSKIYGDKYLGLTKGSATFLNVGGNYPDAPLTLVIWNNDGGIKFYKDKPEIVISNPNQIQESIKVDVS